MTRLPRTLSEAAVLILTTPEPAAKCALSKQVGKAWQDGTMPEVGDAKPPERPTPPAKPDLHPPSRMPKRNSGGTKGRIALSHALAHIEFNAIDLAWDLAVRFPEQDWPKDFYDDWVQVALDEVLHFEMLQDRLADLGASYGDLPAHDALWESAMKTAHDPLARLSIIPMTHEARGLDTTPPAIERLKRAGDAAMAQTLEVIYRDEIKHVRAGLRWFQHLCQRQGLPPHETYHTHVRAYHRSALKRPFNETARHQAGITPDYYLPVAEQEI